MAEVTKASLAREMHEDGFTYAQIAKILQVKQSDAFRMVNGRDEGANWAALGEEWNKTVNWFQKHVEWVKTEDEATIRKAPSGKKFVKRLSI